MQCVIKNDQRVCTLKDGLKAIVRPVGPDDKPLLVRAFEQLSETTRYRRFLHHKKSLTQRELQTFTEFDTRSTYAVGAVREFAGEILPMGIGRLVRISDEDPSRAEVALVVIDQYQGLGVGRLLMECLLEAARARGVTHVRFTMFAENEPMRKLIHTVVGPSRTVEWEGPVLTVEAAVPPPTGREHHPTPNFEHRLPSQTSLRS